MFAHDLTSADRGHVGGSCRRKLRCRLFHHAMPHEMLKGRMMVGETLEELPTERVCQNDDHLVESVAGDIVQQRWLERGPICAQCLANEAGNLSKGAFTVERPDVGMCQRWNHGRVGTDAPRGPDGDINSSA